MAKVVDLTNYLQRAGTRLAADPSFLVQAGEVLVSSVQRNFNEGGRYSGTGDFEGGTQKWKPWSREYAKRQKKRGRSNVLMDRGQLRASIDVRIEGGQLALGSNREYAAIQQFGGTISIAGYERDVKFRRVTKGDHSVIQFARNDATGKDVFTKRVKYPGRVVTIPARPYVAIQSEDATDIAEIAIQNLGKNL